MSPMALEEPVMPSEPSQSFFLSNSSPASPVPFKRLSKESNMSQGSHGKQSSAGGHSDTLAPPPPSPYPQFMDPSPVDSNGTASTGTTEIEDDGVLADDESRDLEFDSPLLSSASPLSPESLLSRIDTPLAARTRSDTDQPQSVIHAPQDFRNFGKSTSPRTNSRPASKQASPKDVRETSRSPTESTSNTIVSPRSPQEELHLFRGASPTLNTNVPPAPAIERVMATPQAKTREEVENEWKHTRRRSSSLERIPESLDADGDDTDEAPEDFPSELSRSTSFDNKIPQERQDSIEALRDCLAQAWGLCISLSGLSSNHRNRIFNYGRKSEVQSQAWRSCWKLCQNLYESREEDHDSQVIPTLDLCRGFCQKLFEARRINRDPAQEAADAVLRVSFELNNHLYNAHDKEAPSGFQERTLEFYLTLCHRMMKQHTALPEETDKLLRTCWQLVEMLFSLRQNTRDGKADDEDLLTAAIHACWELTDQFKAGWTQTFPNRSTPRATQAAFTLSQAPFQEAPTQYTYSDRPASVASVSRSSTRSSSAAMSRASSTRSFTRKEMYQKPPETPTTVFDDTQDHIESLDDDEQPNILILGPENPNAASNSSLHRSSNPHHWSSAASNFSQSSARTSSTATASGSSNARNVTRVRVFLVYVAKQHGFDMPPTPPTTTSGSNLAQYAAARNTTLISWIRSLSTDKFGDKPEQHTMLEKYRKIALTKWPELSKRYCVSQNLVLEHEQSVSYAEVGRAMLWMVRNPKYEGLSDLFKATFNCSIEGALKNAQTTIMA